MKLLWNELRGLALMSVVRGRLVVVVQQLFSCLDDTSLRQDHHPPDSVVDIVDFCTWAICRSTQRRCRQHLGAQQHHAPDIPHAPEFRMAAPISHCYEARLCSVQRRCGSTCVDQGQYETLDNRMKRCAPAVKQWISRQPWISEGGCGW